MTDLAGRRWGQGGREEGASPGARQSHEGRWLALVLRCWGTRGRGSPAPTPEDNGSASQSTQSGGFPLETLSRHPAPWFSRCTAPPHQPHITKSNDRDLRSTCPRSGHQPRTTGSHILTPHTGSPSLFCICVEWNHWTTSVSLLSLTVSVGWPWWELWAATAGLSAVLSRGWTAPPSSQHPGNSI